MAPTAPTTLVSKGGWSPATEAAIPARTPCTFKGRASTPLSSPGSCCDRRTAPMLCRHSTARFSAPSEVRVWGIPLGCPADSIGDSEKFTLEDQGDFTVCIKTFDGLYVS